MQAECVYWCQMTLQPSRKPCSPAPVTHCQVLRKGCLSEPGVAHLVSHMSPGARPQFMTCRVVQGHAAFALQPQPVQDPSPTIPCRGGSTDAETQQDTHACFSVPSFCSLTLLQQTKPGAHCKAVQMAAVGLHQSQVNSSEGWVCHEEGEVTAGTSGTSQFSTDGRSHLGTKKLQLYTKALTAALVGRNKPAGLC